MASPNLLLLLLLLLLGAAAVAPERQQHVAQENLVPEHPYIEQQEVRQEEQDPPLPPGILAAGGTLSPRPSWPGVLAGFPPSWPVATAVTHHCRQLPPHPPTPPLPLTGFSHLHRQAAALGAFRPRLDACCLHREPLRCSRRAWTEVLDGFCTEEFGVKTRQFHCCRHHGMARRRCFAQASATSAGAATEATARVTTWDLVAEPPFPPGEPTAANMGNICGLRALRPGPVGPRGSSGPRGRMRLRLEREYGRCCRNASLACAHHAWQKGLERFCREESAVKTRQHQCCRLGAGRARSHCFATAAADPGYERELYNISLARPGPALLRTLCGPTRLLTKRRPVPELLGAVTGACCELPAPEQSACAQEQLSQGIATLCATPRDAWRDPEGCCSRDGPERRRCFDTTYLARVTLGAAVAPPPHGQDK